MAQAFLDSMSMIGTAPTGPCLTFEPHRDRNQGRHLASVSKTTLERQAQKRLDPTLGDFGFGIDIRENMMKGCRMPDPSDK